MRWPGIGPREGIEGWPVGYSQTATGHPYGADKMRTDGGKQKPGEVGACRVNVEVRLGDWSTGENNRPNGYGDD